MERPQPKRCDQRNEGPVQKKMTFADDRHSMIDWRPCSQKGPCLSSLQKLLFKHAQKNDQKTDDH